nr:hypothetical protein [Tanacetum cinerariifolium]
SGVTHEPYQCQPKNHDYYNEQDSCFDSNSFGFDQSQPQQYTVNHPIFNAHNDYLDSQIQLNSTLATIMEQMTSITSLCEMACTFVQKKLEEKQLEEEQAAKAKNWKLPICYDDDDDEERSDSLDDNIISGLPLFSAITPDEPILSTEEPDNSLSMGDEHLDTIPGCEDYGKNLEEKQLEEAQAVKAQSWKFPVCYDDDDDEEGYNSLNNNIISELPPYSAVTPTEPIDSLSIGDEHLNTISVTESDEFIKSRVENLVPNPSESEGENECDVPAGFTTFSNVLFDDDYDSDSSDDQSLSDEDVREKIYSNPLFDEEIIPMEMDQHSLNVESDLIESMPNHDSSVIISLKIDSLFDEFAGELTLLKSFPPGNDKTDCHPEKEIRLTKRLLYDNSSPRPPKEIVSDNSNADIESFSPSPIPNEDSDSHMEEIDLSFNPDDPMPPGTEDDDYDSERDIPILDKLLDNY